MNTKIHALLLLLLVGCEAQTATGELPAPPPAVLHVEDMWPEMVDATGPAWERRFGAPCNTHGIELMFVPLSQLGELCRVVPVTYAACSGMTNDKIAAADWMLENPEYLAQVIGHELGHFCAYRVTGDETGNGDHSDPRIWDPTTGFAAEVSQAALR